MKVVGKWPTDKFRPLRALLDRKHFQNAAGRSILHVTDCLTAAVAASSRKRKTRVRWMLSAAPALCGNNQVDPITLPRSQGQ